MSFFNMAECYYIKQDRVTYDLEWNGVIIYNSYTVPSLRNLLFLSYSFAE
jgi:hypothetical protein